MAVPDWPTTFGYNMFLYPWQTWFFGPWDLFIEHGHRLFGAAGGHAERSPWWSPSFAAIAAAWLRAVGSARWCW